MPPRIPHADPGRPDTRGPLRYMWWLVCKQPNTTALLLWCGAILVAGVALAWLGIMRHRTMTFIREDATARSAGLLVRHLAKVGAVLPRKMAAGEIATIGGS